MQARNAASVLPDPVGAEISVVAPRENVRPPLLLRLGRRAKLRAQTTPQPEGAPRPESQEGTASGYSSPKPYFRQPFAQHPISFDSPAHSLDTGNEQQKQEQSLAEKRPSPSDGRISILLNRGNSVEPEKPTLLIHPCLDSLPSHGRCAIQPPEINSAPSLGYTAPGHRHRTRLGKEISGRHRPSQHPRKHAASLRPAPPCWLALR